MADTMVVYTHPECSYSEALKAELDDLGAEYREIDLGLKPEG
ncbi:MAG: hypothetical protein IIC87_05390, partial [Chloroflexi bacterium]|nr:hypothetical protein [Chloroflexota bacterium]